MLIFRRRVGIDATGNLARGEVRAALEDDFHHFRVRLTHAAERVQRVEGWAVRHPYSTCPLAAAQLSHLQGAPLNGLANAVMRLTDPAEQCTHLLELAGLAIAAAARPGSQRWYEATVPRRVDGGTRATLERDGQRILAWELLDSTIIGPAPFHGLPLRKGMTAWALTHLTAEETEAALVLRRCALISMGREKDLDVQVHAEPTGRCFVQQPQRAPQGLRQVGSTMDFTAIADQLCASDFKWLKSRGDEST